VRDIYNNLLIRPRLSRSLAENDVHADIYLGQTIKIALRLPIDHPLLIDEHVRYHVVAVPCSVSGKLHNSGMAKSVACRNT